MHTCNFLCSSNSLIIFKSHTFELIPWRNTVYVLSKIFTLWEQPPIPSSPCPPSCCQTRPRVRRTWLSPPWWPSWYPGDCAGSRWSSGWTGLTPGSKPCSSTLHIAQGTCSEEEVIKVLKMEQAYHSIYLI